MSNFKKKELNEDEISNILNNIKTTITINDKKEIYFGPFKYEDKYITYEELQKYKYIKNIKIFSQFLDKIKEGIQEYEYNYELTIQLEINKDIQNSKLYDCLFTFFNPIDNKKFKYKELDILKYKDNSLSQGFIFMIDNINDIYKSYNNNNTKNNLSKSIENKCSYNEKIKIIKTIDDYLPIQLLSSYQNYEIELKKSLNYDKQTINNKDNTNIINNLSNFINKDNLNKDNKNKDLFDDSSKFEQLMEDSKYTDSKNKGISLKLFDNNKKDNELETEIVEKNNDKKLQTLLGCEIISNFEIKDLKEIGNLIARKSEFNIYMNKKGKEPVFYIDGNITIGRNGIILEPQKFINCIKYWINFKDKNNINKKYNIFSFFLHFLEEIHNEFKYNYKLKISLIFNEEKDNIISCKYIFYEPINNNKEKEFKEENIFNNQINSPILNELIDEINKKCFENINYYDNNYKLFKLKTIQDEFSFKKIINQNYNIKFELIEKLNNGFYLAFGCNKIIIVYDESFDQKMIIKEFENNLDVNISNIILDKKNEAKLVLKLNGELKLIILDLKKFKYNIQNNIKLSNTICREIKGQKIIFNYYDINKELKINEFINEPFVKGRNIIDNLFTFIFKIPNGGDILLFYDYKKYKIVKEIIGYFLIYLKIVYI